MILRLAQLVAFFLFGLALAARAQPSLIPSIDPVLLDNCAGIVQWFPAVDEENRLARSDYYCLELIDPTIPPWWYSVVPPFWRPTPDPIMARKCVPTLRPYRAGPLSMSFSRAWVRGEEEFTARLRNILSSESAEDWRESEPRDYVGYRFGPLTPVPAPSFLFPGLALLGLFNHLRRP